MEVNNSGFFISLRARLIIGFLTLSLPLLLLIMLLLPKVNAVVFYSKEIYEENLPQVLDTTIFQSQNLVLDWIITGDPKYRARFAHVWSEINEIKQQWDEGLARLGNEKILDEWRKLRDLYEPLYQAQSAIINAPRSLDVIGTLKKNLEQTQPIENQMINIIDGVFSEDLGKRVGGLTNNLVALIDKNTSHINHNLHALTRSAYVLLILGVILTIIVPLGTLSYLASPIDRVIEVAQRIAAGERDIEIEIPALDRLGRMLLSVKTMQQAIKENEEKLREQEEESRQLFEQLVSTSKKFSEYSSKVAAGDLRERLSVDKNDILYELGNDLDSMTDGLASITKKITQVSNDIVAMADKVLTSANEQTESINSQASAINEISASLEEIDKSTKQTMNKAQTLREVAKSTYEQGKLGSESVVQSIEGIKISEEKMQLIAQTIRDLSTHTQQIGEITAVVNTLAQQSKMLALNAAIEASKAGEAGKGFAAVATEVRNLAEQSEQSTVQVQKILEDIKRTTEKAVEVTEEGATSLGSGMQLIEKAGEVIQTLSKMINEASISSQHIEVAIRQEAVGIEQIVESMNEINRTTSTFSGGLKEMMDFIHKLNAIAKHLKDDVNIYKV
ncbi:methyl-accepting chemotaxis protein [Legionella saoudiensis]|uniref:methyl-accepting chemotaxis protein n=1 Tax=Legionella saoudiensis TaxID=1750561 RepID=UPI000730D509|nr:methyl-accepting chemotaxis protein [Legionella saoudiensis]